MLFSNLTPRKYPIAVLLFFIFFIPPSGIGAPQKNHFPHFTAIRDNVIFWENVYSTYSVNTAVIHDKDDLAKIYETVSLLDKNLPGADRVNRSNLKRMKKNYSDILKNLALGKTPTSPAEKRVFNMFSPPKIHEKFKKASDNLRIQTGLKERFREGVIRSGAYMETIKAIFRSYKLPEDLAYLPHVESSFNIKAYSKFGAAGIWQFTRSTGKNFMTIDYIVDERRDPLIATHAAAKYLKQSFEALGSWPLAITAYNYGHAGMLRAAKQEGTYERIFKNYDKGHFKFASRNFYSEFLAALNVAKQLENSNSLQPDKPRRTFSMKLQGFAHVTDVSNYFNISIPTMQSFNLSLRTPVWHGEKFVPQGFLLQLPDNQDMIQLARNFPSQLLHKQQKRSKFYKVRQGDTAGKIARTNGVTLMALSNANNLNKDAVVYIGQTLRIPSLPQKSPTVKGTSGSASIAPPDDTLPTLSKSKKSAPSWKVEDPKRVASAYDLSVISTTLQNGVVRGEIIVQPEESLGIYAEWLRISKKKLLQLNGISGDESIHPGQKIALPFVNTTQSVFEDQRQDFHQETEEDFFSSYKVTGFKQYRVAHGDTVWDICQNKFDLPLWLLKKYNSDLNYNKLDSRQRLKIPIVESL